MSAVSCIERFRQNLPVGWHDSHIALKPILASPDTNCPHLPIDKKNSSNVLKGPLPEPAEEERVESTNYCHMGSNEGQYGKGNEPGSPADVYELSTMGPRRRSTSGIDACIVAHDLTLGWPEHDDVISGLYCTIKRSRFAAVTGGMGSGKSTLLRSFLGEAKISSGTLATSFTRAAYCSQTPWLLNQTIRQNILGTNCYESNWYSTVLNACELEQDVENMSGGDLSVIGSEGVRLSGGQRKRLVWYPNFIGN
jgi:ABC-type multidrug transport system fused ATPase/permease subunit